MKQRPVAGPCSAGAVANETPVERMSSAKVAPERVALDLADIGGGDAERGDADHGVGGRAARDHARIDARSVKRLGAILVDQRHRALQHVLGAEVLVVGKAEDVDERIAQSQHLDRRAHRASRTFPRPSSHWRETRSIARTTIAGRRQYTHISPRRLPRTSSASRRLRK